MDCLNKTTKLTMVGLEPDAKCATDGPVTDSADSFSSDYSDGDSKDSRSSGIINSASTFLYKIESLYKQLKHTLPRNCIDEIIDELGGTSKVAEVWFFSDKKIFIRTSEVTIIH